MSHFLISPGSANTVLIVDDSVENLQMLSALLKDDYRVKVAKGGLKAIELITTDPQIDLVLLDIVMPDLDGYQVCEILKKNPLTSKIPVIFLTALNDIADETKGFHVGGADFITKPFNSEIVKARVRTHLELREERKITERLLKVILPDNVIDQLLRKGTYTPEIHLNTSILFCDLDGFTQISSSITPEDLIKELSDIFSNFDTIASANNAMRIKTIGDAYMAVTGLDSFEDPGIHVAEIIKTGFQFINYLKERNTTSAIQWKCKVGIHTGSIISGLVGHSRFQFDVMGDNVNIAARVERNSSPMVITITNQVLELLDRNSYKITSKGEVYLKGKGNMELFEVTTPD